MILTKLITAATFVVGVLFSLATAAAVPDVHENLQNADQPLESPLQGYTISKAMFSGTMLGQNYELNGTVQEVIGKLEKIHNVKNLTSVGVFGAGDSAVDNELPARVPRALCIPVPGQNWAYATIFGVQMGIAALRSAGGQSYVSRRSCARVSCVRRTSIWVCNDNNETISADNVHVANHAERIWNQCVFVSHSGTSLSGGQLFPVGYNVVEVGDGNCR